MVILLLSLWTLQFTLPMHSEMLIKGHFPEELSARSGPACSGGLRWLICRGHHSSSGEWLCVRLCHLCRTVLALLSEDNAVPMLGGGAGLLGNQPPRLWVKLRCRVS